jgi:hypothetical protein
MKTTEIPTWSSSPLGWALPKKNKDHLEKSNEMEEKPYLFN